MSVSELHQIDWHAFCYVANELSAEERLAFEESLAIDQVAREALARAVELTRAVAAAGPHDFPSHDFAASGAAETSVVVKASGNWTRRVSWMAIGAAASLLAAVLVSSFGDRQPASAWLNPDSVQSNRELAFAWSEARAEIGPRESAWSDSELSELTDELAASYAPDHESPDSAAAETPSWMTAALLAQAEHSPDQPLHDALDGEPLEN